MTGSLIGRILMKIFHNEGSAGFYYENPANDLSDGENFVQVRMSDDDIFLIGDEENGDGENDDNRGHNADDHDNCDGSYHLHVDEESGGDGNQDDGNHKSRGDVHHVYVCGGNIENHGHGDGDHEGSNQTTSDDEGNNLEGGDEKADIDHGSCRGCASGWLLYQRCGD